MSDEPAKQRTVRAKLGRPKQWHEYLRLPLAEGTTARLDAARNEGEDRLTVIRTAIEAELTKRETARRRDP